MTHRDEIEKSVDEMLAGWFNGEGHDVDRNDIIELVMKHSTVAAEPFGWIKPGAATNDEKYDYGMFAYRQQEDTPVAIYTAPPVPSVAVKDIEFLAEVIDNMDWSAFGNEEKAWAAKVKGEAMLARIRSALSAQVQDVARLPDDYYSDDPAKLKQLLAQRDKWLVDNDHWHDFTRSLPAAPAKQGKPD